MVIGFKEFPGSGMRGYREYDCWEVSTPRLFSTAGIPPFDIYQTLIGVCETVRERRFY